jgi:hypothetical protein
MCIQCLSSLKLWVRTPFMAKCTTLYDKVCQRLVTGLWFSQGTPVSSTNKTDLHDITGILLRVALNTINHQNQPTNLLTCKHLRLTDAMFISVLALYGQTTLDPLWDVHKRILKILNLYEVFFFNQKLT